MDELITVPMRFQILNREPLDTILIDHVIHPVYVGDRWFSVSKLPFNTKVLANGIAGRSRLLIDDEVYVNSTVGVGELFDIKLTSDVLAKWSSITIMTFRFRIKRYYDLCAELGTHNLSIVS